jgi:hypothetical protein
MYLSSLRARLFPASSNVTMNTLCFSQSQTYPHLRFLATQPARDLVQIDHGESTRGREASFIENVNLGVRSRSQFSIAQSVVQYDKVARCVARKPKPLFQFAKPAIDGSHRRGLRWPPLPKPQRAPRCLRFRSPWLRDSISEYAAAPGPTPECLDRSLPQVALNDARRAVSLSTVKIEGRKLMAARPKPRRIGRSIVADNPRSQ